MNDDLLSEFTARNASALKTLVEEHQVQLRRLPDDVLERLKLESTAVVAEIAAGNELALRIYESYTRFFEESRKYHAISEQAYINVR
jgi:TRAP-type mannitol/chloroaromatic compound transport system substrate-binding protein